MRAPAVLMILTISFLHPGVAASETSSAAQPSAVTVASGGMAVVGWTAGAVAADEYRVYGADGDDLTLLGIFASEDRVALVSPGFSTYGVSAVKNGIETKVTHAAGICVSVDHSPPTIAVGCLGTEIAPVP